VVVGNFSMFSDGFKACAAIYLFSFLFFLNGRYLPIYLARPATTVS
jgi:hypothetical protein